MRNTIIGLCIGTTFGIVIGASVIAPRLHVEHPETEDPIATAITEVSVPTIDATVSAASVTWTVPPVDPQLPPSDQALIQRGFAAIDQATGGEVHARELLGELWNEDGSDVYSLVQDGELDAAIVDPGAGAAMAPVLDLFGSAPFGPRPRELSAWLYAGDGNNQLAEVHAKLGLHALPCAIKTSGSGGWFRKAIAAPSDLVGLRMRIEGLAAEAAKKLGVEAVEFKDSQLLAAFRTGHIDAAETATPSDDVELSLHEGASHYLFPGWHKPASLMVLLTSLETWESLPEIRRSQIQLACGDNVRHGIAASEAIQFEALRSMAEKGVDVARLPDDVVDAFSTAWRDVAAEKADADPAFSAVWQSLETFRADYAIWQEISAH